MAASKIISQFLDTTGDGTGTTNARVDGSSTPVVFKFAPTSRCAIYRLIVHIEDNGTVVASNYGAIAGPLTNGLAVTHVDDSSNTLALSGQINIKSNQDWARLCYDTSYTTFGSGNEFVSVRWTFARSGIPLFMESGDELRVTVNDNLTTLVEQYFLIQGYYT